MAHCLGIDVSAKTLDVVDSNELARVRQFAQTPEGHRKLVCFARQHKAQAIVMEATGIYYLDIALALHQAGLPVSVINPRSFHHFAKACLQTNKTDQIDARLLADYAQRMSLRLWQPPSREQWALREIARRINQLNGLQVMEKNRLHALQAQHYTYTTLIDELQAHINYLTERIKQLADTAMAYIQADQQLNQYYLSIISTVGIAQASAIALLGELALLPESMKAKQVSRHAGLDVQLKQSGTSLNQPGRLSKAGNTYLRAALHMPSLSFVRHDPYAKAHYQQLQQRGKKKMQALCAIQRKMLTGLWACLRNNQPFDSSLLFAIKPDNA